MRHEIKAAIKAGFAGAFRFHGRMARAEFWLWVAVLSVVASLALTVENLPWGKENVAWPSILGLIDRTEWLKDALQWPSKAWPPLLSLTPFPLGTFIVGYSQMFFTMPVLVAINLLALAPIARRSRDAGYSPFLTIIMANCAIFAFPIFLLAALLIGLALGDTGFYMVLGMEVNFGIFTRFLSTVAMVFALYRLSAPSKPGPNPLEVTP